MPLKFVSKPCVGCGVIINDVAPNTKWCADCRRKRRREIEKKQRKNPGQPERRAKNRREYYERNREHEQETHRAWMENHRDQQREYRISHRAHEAERARIWRAANKDRYLDTCRRYRDRNRIELREQALKRYWSNPERARTIARLRREVRKGIVSASIALAKMTGKMKTCERLHLTALTLPCGRYPSCLKCPSCPPGRLNLYRSAMAMF